MNPRELRAYRAEELRADLPPREVATDQDEFLARRDHLKDDRAVVDHIDAVIRTRRRIHDGCADSKLS